MTRGFHQGLGRFFVIEELRLFALFRSVIVDELTVRPLGPAPRRLILFAGEHANGHRDRYTPGVEIAALIDAESANRFVFGVCIYVCEVRTAGGNIGAQA